MAKTNKAQAILIVEDETEVRNFAVRVFELEGYHVLQAEDGDTGLRLARENQVALVLLDLRLPGSNGWDVLEKIKADPDLHTISVVVFSASAAIDQRDRAFTIGAADYLVKPVSANNLKKTVARLLRKKGRR